VIITTETTSKNGKINKIMELKDGRIQDSREENGNNKNKRKEYMVRRQKAIQRNKR
jgi:hypothetical protein